MKQTADVSEKALTGLFADYMTYHVLSQAQKNGESVSFPPEVRAKFRANAIYFLEPLEKMLAKEAFNERLSLIQGILSKRGVVLTTEYLTNLRLICEKVAQDIALTTKELDEIDFFYRTISNSIPVHQPK